MGNRIPPNKGIVLFPAVWHFRCTQAMLEEIKARGGGHWLRSLIAANVRPVDVSPTLTAAPELMPVSQVTRKNRSSKRVSLDKRKRRKV